MQHPIQVAARRAGVSVDVLRAWERRYALVAPARASGGRRLYSESDIERLRLIASAAAAGRRVGELAQLDGAALAALVSADRASAAAPQDAGAAASLLANCMRAVEQLDGAALRATLRRALIALPAPACIEQLVAPLMHAIGERWSRGELSPAHEHVASSIVRRELQATTEALAGDAAGATLVVAAPAGQQHELGAHAAALVAVLDGFRPTQLGADLPAEDIARAAQELRAAAIVLSISTVPDGCARELAALRAATGPDLPIFAGGRAAGRRAAGLSAARVQRVDTLNELRAALRALPIPMRATR
jgi:DNA-binding transcriptional MerR regulator